MWKGGINCVQGIVINVDLRTFERCIINIVADRIKAFSMTYLNNVHTAITVTRPICKQFLFWFIYTLCCKCH